MEIARTEKQDPPGTQSPSKPSQNEEGSHFNVLKMIVSNWKTLTPKRYTRKSLKIYEEQQLKEIPGVAKKTGTVMHAALTSEIDSEDYKVDGHQMDTGMKVRNHALIHYIAKLAVSNHNNDTFDFSFVESLLTNGADINAMDKYGQTVFHEVARSWHPDVAEFLLRNGANINQQDKYGRAPLHVSAAVDYVEMVEFLVSKGADINIRTPGELQTPIHFAAKNDACKCLKALIAYGVDVNCRDYQDRTPLQLAAAMTRKKTARLLIEMGAPSGVYDKDGEMALSLLVIKMPDVAKIALDQFQSEDKINHKRYFFLNYLEGSRVVDGSSAARTPLEAAVVSNSIEIIMHPVMQCLIVTKWEKFVKRWAWFNFVVNTLSAVIWTTMGVTLPLENDKLYNPPHKTWWRMVLASIALLLTFYEIVRQLVSSVRTKRALSQWKNHRESSLLRDKPFCHPQWPDEQRYVDSEIKRVREYPWFGSHDRWIYIDWTALFLIIAAAVSHVVFFLHGSRITHTVHVRIMCLLLIVIWLRILKFVRPFQGTGAFVASFTKMLGDILLTLFLVAIIFLPYASAFWIMFGGLSPRPAKGYKNLPAILYEVFMMTVLDTNHDIKEFINVDPFMARVLSCTYVCVSYVIVLNLIIAMITHKFKRVYSYAQEHAAMERAKTILNIENSLRQKSRNMYWDYIRLQCSPLIVDKINRHDRRNFQEIVNMNDRVKETLQIVQERFATSLGEGKGMKVSTMEEMLKYANEIVTNYATSKQMLLTVFRSLKSLEERAMKMKPKDAEEKSIEINKKTVDNSENIESETKWGFLKQARKRRTKSVDAVDQVSSKRRYSTRSEPDPAEREPVEIKNARTQEKAGKKDTIRRRFIAANEKHRTKGLDNVVESAKKRRRSAENSTECDIKKRRSRQRVEQIQENKRNKTDKENDFTEQNTPQRRTSQKPSDA